MLTVATALIRRAATTPAGRSEMRILLQQRDPGDGREFPWMWCCPGGKVQDGESPRVAVVREVLEEHGIDICVGAEIACVSFYPPTVRKACTLFTYSATILGESGALGPLPDERLVSWTQSQRARIHDGVLGLGWFTVEEARALQGSPSLRLLLTPGLGLCDAEHLR